MRIVMRILLLFLAAPLLLPSPVIPCTTFFLSEGDTRVFGKNYDWDVEAGHVLVNKRGVAKRAAAGENPAVWVSRQGSVTFNQYGREFPCGGMNESGLVVEVLWLDESVYPEPADRRSIGPLQWIQYQLDNCVTIDEVIATDGTLRVVPTGSAKVHYLVADRSGRCASIEFIGGEMVARSGESMPHPVLTNHTYDESIAHLGRCEAFGGDAPVGESRGSADRFVRTAIGARDFREGPDDPVDYAFTLLNDAAMNAYNRWRIVYDIRPRRIFFRTSAIPEIREIDAASFDYSCRTPALLLDMGSDREGDVTDLFLPATTEANLELILRSFGETDMTSDTPREVLEQIANYPESLPCTATE